MPQHVKISWIQSTEFVDHYFVYLKEGGTSITPGNTPHDAKINKGDLGDLLSWSEGNVSAGQKRILVSRYSHVTGYHTVFDITKDIPAGQTGEFTVPSSERHPDESASITAEKLAQAPEPASSITVSYSPASPGTISLEHSPNAPLSTQSQVDLSPAQPSVINVESSPAHPATITTGTAPAQPSSINAAETVAPVAPASIQAGQPQGTRYEFEITDFQGNNDDRWYIDYTGIGTNPQEDTVRAYDKRIDVNKGDVLYFKNSIATGLSPTVYILTKGWTGTDTYTYTGFSKTVVEIAHGETKGFVVDVEPGSGSPQEYQMSVHPPVEGQGMDSGRWFENSSPEFGTMYINVVGNAPIQYVGVGAGSAWHWGIHNHNAPLENNFCENLQPEYTEATPYTWKANAFALNPLLAVENPSVRYQSDRNDLQTLDGTYILFENGDLYFRHCEYDSSGGSSSAIYGPSGNSYPWIEQLVLLDTHVLKYFADGAAVHWIKYDGSLWFGDSSFNSLTSAFNFMSGDPGDVGDPETGWNPQQLFGPGEIVDIQGNTRGVIALKRDGTLIGRGHHVDSNKYMFGGSPGSAYDVSSPVNVNYTDWITDDPIDTNVIEYVVCLECVVYIKAHPVTGRRCMYISGVNWADIIDVTGPLTAYQHHRQRIYLESETVDGQYTHFPHPGETIAPDIRMLRANRRTVSYAYDQWIPATNTTPGYYRTRIGYFGSDGVHGASHNSGSYWPHFPVMLETLPDQADDPGIEMGLPSPGGHSYNWSDPRDNTQYLKDYSLTEDCIYMFNAQGDMVYGDGKGYLPQEIPGVTVTQTTWHDVDVTGEIWFKMEDPQFDTVTGDHQHSIAFYKSPNQVPNTPTITAITAPLAPSVITSVKGPNDPASITIELDPLGTPVVSVSAGATWDAPTNSLPASFSWAPAAGATHYTYTWSLYGWLSANTNPGWTLHHMNNTVTVNPNEPLEFNFTQSIIDQYSHLLDPVADGYVMKLRLRAVNAGGYTWVNTDIFYKP